ncbi:asparagine synthase (glutamine-hydrolysing) [Azospirillaceae bacterium]|nr:hypothetical protein MTCCP1_00055 [uncultured bacterium]
MAFFAGTVTTEEQGFSADDLWRLQALAATHGDGKPALWQGECGAFAQTLRPVTPEDRFDRLPGCFAGGSSVMVFDGRLDNRDDLTEALGIAQERVATMGDGALTMAALERWGEEACPRLIGDFAFAWWNGRARRLVLACDAVGGRTVYVHAGPQRLCFATRPLAVLGFPGVPREVDMETMACFLLARPLPAGFTPFRGVFRLPPAGRLVWQDGRCRIERHWWPDPTRRIRYRDSRDYVAAARELLDQAVTAQLRLIGPVVCHLSGGLDSSGVAATAARLLPQSTVHTLTMVPDPTAPLPAQPDGRRFDEGPLAAATAALYSNIVHHIVPAGELTADEFDPTRLFRAIGYPVRNYLNFGAWQPAFAKARELGATVILTGDGGNATLSWQNRSLWPHLRRHLTHNVAPSGLYHLWRRLCGKAAIEWMSVSAISPEFAAGISLERILKEPPFTIGSDRFNRHLHLDFLERHWARRPVQANLGFATGCELRDPLSDRRLTEFTLAIPRQQWQLGGVPRSFARRVLSDRLPPMVVNFMGRGRQCADWFHRLSGLRETFLAEIERLEASPTARRMLDLARLKALANDWPANADAAEHRREEFLAAFGRGVYYGQFIRWVEGSNG